MSFVLNWVQRAARLLKEATEEPLAREAMGEEWLAEVRSLLKPSTPRTGE
jgi:hypothetical protein